ncbi:cellulase family glycosylhydrolase [Corynebacterium parakroppenstedtii]|uniref:cellulase family glycosylhydrolase n=1 Tax=Corynebacterium parakroppenstedtii TaxID=2828363 RepID=UPI001F016A2D|nr:cellulase family glycosylhydrolase [Corynebacterium parakroppenstedtii]MCF8711240.1 cellulase family glycosylhydrolase [Corynebacterium parakroppenstedtii]
MKTHSPGALPRPSSSPAPHRASFATRTRGLAATHSRALFAIVAAAVLVASAMTLIPRTALAGSQQEPASITARGHIGQSGKWYTDGSGRAVLTQGVNMVYKHPPYTAEAGGFNEDDADWLAKEGFDSVRLGIIWKAVEPEPGQYDDAYLDSIANTVKMLGKRGIMTLIDAHQDMYNEKFEGEFAPDWAVIDDGLPSLLKVGFPTNQAVNIGLIRAYDNFLTNKPGPGGVGLQDRYAAMWKHVAEKMGSLPGMMGYDIMNEPWPGSAYPLCYLALGDCGAATQHLDALHQKAADSITSVDPQAIVHYEPYSMWNMGFNTRPTAPRVPASAGTALSWHVYCPTNAIAGTYTGCTIPDGITFNNADNVSAANNSATLLSEFGATDDADTLLGVTNLARQHLTGWQYWSYCGCDDPTTQNQKEQGIVADPTVGGPVTADAVNKDKLAIVAAPHLRAAAGTPTSTNWDPKAKTYTASWTTDRVDGKGTFDSDITSEIVVPTVNYSNGFSINVEGGTAEVAKDGTTVHVTAHDKNVRITIAPK